MRHRLARHSATLLVARRAATLLVALGVLLAVSCATTLAADRVSPGDDALGAPTVAVDAQADDLPVAPLPAAATLVIVVLLWRVLVAAPRLDRPGRAVLTRDRGPPLLPSC
jgi:hypothetical protein